MIQALARLTPFLNQGLDRTSSNLTNAGVVSNQIQLGLFTDIKASRSWEGEGVASRRIIQNFFYTNFLGA